jgi:hypothetical protein
LGPYRPRNLATSKKKDKGKEKKEEKKKGGKWTEMDSGDKARKEKGCVG